MNDTNTQSETVERLLAIAAGIAAAAQQPGQTDDTLRALAEQAVESLLPIGRDPGATRHLIQLSDLEDALFSDYGKRQAAAAANGGVVGVRTGLNHLDEALNGLEPGKLYMLAAMPGTGKTTLALQWAATVAQAGSTALYISLENDSIDLARKLACRLGQVRYSDALKGKLSRQDWAMAVQSLQRLQGRLFLATPRASMPNLPSLVESFKEYMGAPPALIVLDYLQAFTKRMSSDGGEGDDVRSRIDRFTPELRALGERYGCAVLAISAQNRANYLNGGMAAMKESGDLEYNADAILTLSKSDEKDKTYDITRDPRLIPLKLTLDKNRQGVAGSLIKLVFDADYCMVEEEDR